MDRTTIFLLLLGCSLAILSRGFAEVIYGYEDPDVNLVKRGDFEDITLEEMDDLHTGCTKKGLCQVAIAEDGHTGDNCLKIVSEGTSRQVPYITLKNLTLNTEYYASVFLKFEEIKDHLTRLNITYLSATFLVFEKVEKGQKVPTPHKAGYLKFQRASKSWFQLGGFFKLKTSTEVMLFIEVKPIGTFFLDTVSVMEIKKNPNLKDDLKKKIAEIRKSQINLSLRLPRGYDNFEVKLNLVKHTFPFGTAVRCQRMYTKNSETDANYRDFLLNVMGFNMLTCENDMKWGIMEKKENSPNYYVVDEAMKKFDLWNVSSRFHSLIWSVKDCNPGWLDRYEDDPQGLQDAVMRRIDYVVNRYKGRIAEYDVCNEFMQTRYYEDTTHNYDLFEDEVAKAYSIDPDACYCFNDYLLIRSDGWLSSAQANIARQMLERGVKLCCIGAQSHLRSPPVDFDVMVHNLRILGQSGLNISITEFSVHTTNQTLKAETFDMAYHVFFADKNVQSISSWALIDQFQPFSDDAYVTVGKYFELNEAGERLRKVLREDFNTTVTYNTTETRLREKISGFHGSYELAVYSDGVELCREDFYLEEGGSTFKYNCKPPK